MEHRITTHGLRVAAATMLVALPAFAQNNNINVEQFDRQLEQIRRNTRMQVNQSIPVGQRTYLDYGAYTSFIYLSLDSPTTNNNVTEITNTAFRQYELGAYANLVIDNTHEFFFRGRLYHRDFNPGDRFSSDGENIDGRIDRLFYRFDLARFQAAYQGKQTDNDVSVKLGRDLLQWGNGLTLSTDMDGGVVDLISGAASLQLIAGVTPLDTVDFDSARPRFDSRTKRGLYGALAAMRVGQHRPYIYALDQRDYNNDNLIEGDDIDGTPATPTHFHYESYYLGIGSTGALTDRLLYGIEAVYEGGHTLSSSFILDANQSQVVVPQTRDTIQAFAIDARLDYVIPDAHATRLSAEMILASGDDDRISSTTSTYGGNKPNTTDNAFTALGLLDVGTAFSPSVSNLLMFRVGGSTFPFPDTHLFRKLQLGTDIYWFNKLDANAPIDEATTNNSWLGIEPDIYMNWQITSDISLSMRYGLFIPGDAIVEDQKMRQFFYTGLTVAF